MMELKVSEWKEFRLDRLFVLRGGFYNKKPEHSVAGHIPFLGSTENDNGVTEFYSLDDIRAWDKVGLPDDSLDGKLFDGGCVAVTVNGSVCNAFYQAEQFTCSHDITALYVSDMRMTEFVGLFVASVIMKDKYRWSYGRKPHSIEKFGKSLISLPVQHDTVGQPVIDPSRKYSDDGYVPDWDFMEQYMKSLNTQSLVTQESGESVPELGVEKWKEFQVGRLFDVTYGVNLEFSKCVEADFDSDNAVAFVSRTGINNGVSGYVEVIDGIPLQQADTITVAGGGSVLSTFLQPNPFYSGRDLYLLNSKTDLSKKSKLFLATVIEANKYRFNYGRQANVTLPFLWLRLPIQHDTSGNPVIDPSKKYSDDGYIPDWAFMEQYIGSLPGGDLI